MSGKVSPFRQVALYGCGFAAGGVATVRLLTFFRRGEAIAAHQAAKPRRGTRTFPYGRVSAVGWMR
jgi:Flp pilus assembly protein protease CpaA